VSREAHKKLKLRCAQLGKFQYEVVTELLLKHLPEVVEEELEEAQESQGQHYGGVWIV